MKRENFSFEFGNRGSEGIDLELSMDFLELHGYNMHAERLISKSRSFM